MNGNNNIFDNDDNASEAQNHQDIKRCRQNAYERKRRHAELILERQRLKQMLDVDDIDFEW